LSKPTQEYPLDPRFLEGGIDNDPPEAIESFPSSA
jgi:hypothetical protein